LRQRGDDVLLLAETLLDRVSGSRLRRRLSSEATDWLRRYPYPGNVRELRNILERACLLCDGDEIHLQHLPLELAAARSLPISSDGPPPATRDFPDSNSLSFEEAVRNFKGSRKALAAYLGLSERTLYRRLKTADGRQRRGSGE
jgi:two-component system response regulator HydG